MSPASAARLSSRVGAASQTGRGARAPWPAWLWLPSLAVAAAALLPLLYLALRALGAGAEVWELLFRPRTAQILGRTLALVVAVTGVSLAISLTLAWLTTRTDVPLRRLWAVLTALPLVIPSYVAGFVVVAALGPRGLLQQLLAPLGVERIPEIYGFPGALLVVTMVAFPYLLLTLQASFKGLDPALEEASRSLGRGPWHTFFRVTLPQLRPAIAAGALLVALYTLRDFGGVSLLRYETFTWAIYLQYQTSLDRMVAAALALVLVAVAVGFLLLEVFTRGRSRYHRSTVGTSRPPRVISLGAWRVPALAFCVSVVLFSVAIPVSVLGYWLMRGIVAGEPVRIVWGAALNSGYASALAAAVTTIAALFIAVLSVRHASRLSGLVERATYIGFALPGIVIALALVFFAVNFAAPVYQTLGLLIFAYLVL
ncbi:MAG TPA: iron ABC transporter permease, partial [Dehalococcoidia bacterium]|nr:iron ABC transporter permease [Dehalococcoidia bacterium]